MMRPDTALIWLSVRALHAPRTPRASTKPAYPRSSLVRSFIEALPTRPIVVRHLVVTHRYDLHRRITHVAQESIDDGTVQGEIPTRPGGLAENDVRDPFSLRKLDEQVGDARALQLHHLGAELLREADVVGERDMIVRLDAAWLLPGRLDVDGEPVRREPARDA